MKIKDILLRKNNALITVGPDDSVRKAADVLTAYNIGALPVYDHVGALVGIISERDIARGLSERGGGIDQFDVSALMSSDVITCDPEDDVEMAMSVLSARHIRHIPVLVDGRLTAMISSRDVMEAVLEETRAHRDTLAIAYEMVR